METFFLYQMAKSPMGYLAILFLMPRQYFYGVSRYLKRGACLIQVLFNVFIVLGTGYLLA